MTKWLFLCLFSFLSVCVCLGDDIITVKGLTNSNVNVTNTNSVGDVIITVKGVTYRNVKVAATDVSGIKVLHKTGVGYIPYNEMTPSDQAKWGYDQKKLEAVLTEQQQQKENKDKLKNTDYFTGQILQVVDDGILCKGGVITKEMREKKQKEADRIDKLERDVQSGKTKLTDFETALFNDQKSRRKMFVPAQGTYFIAGVKEGYIDGERWSGYVYKAGVYKYINTLRARTTIRAYATSEELAKKRLSDNNE